MDNVTQTDSYKENNSVDRKNKENGERAFLAAIVQSSEEAIISKDLNGIITSWNPAAEKMFGYSPGEAIGKPMTLIYPLDRLNEFQDIIEKVKKGISVERYETKRKAKNGNIIAVSVTVSPVKNEQGKIIGISAMDRDISGQKKAETQSLSLAVSSTHFFRQLFSLSVNDFHTIF